MDSLDFGHKQKNVTLRSFVLAPFNSTITNSSFKNLLDEVPIEPYDIIKFNDQVREANR